MKEIVIGILMIVGLVGGIWWNISEANKCADKGGRYMIIKDQWPICAQEAK